MIKIIIKNSLFKTYNESDILINTEILKFHVIKVII